MSYLFFMDESGHDHQTCPYEVRGGVVLHASKLWDFIRDVGTLEESCFGTQLSDFGAELKGSRLLERKRFKHAKQGIALDDAARRKHALAFLQRGRVGARPSEIEFRAYGQACLEMCRGVFRILKTHEGKVFAAAIPRSAKKPTTQVAEEYLRKDLVFLLERYFYFVTDSEETGLLVLDETDHSTDRKFVKQMERYFLRTSSGRFRSTAIVPVPIFVRSDLARGIQVADICIYAISWGFRRRDMDAERRSEISEEFSAWLATLEASGRTSKEEDIIRWSSIVFVPDPFSST